MMQQLLLWGDDQPQLPAVAGTEMTTEVENFIECIHFDGSREVVSTLDPSVDWRDKTVWSAGFVRREKYEEYQKKRTNCHDIMGI